MKHTKGKWMIAKTGRKSREIVADTPYVGMLGGDEVTPICKMMDYDGKINANMALISKAPEMLKALKDIVERYPNSPWIIDNLKSLINEIES